MSERPTIALKRTLPRSDDPIWDLGHYKVKLLAAYLESS